MSEKYEKKRFHEFLNYDKKLNLELLKNSENLTEDLKLKFISYSALQFNHLNWEIRDQYIELLDKFINKKIDSFNFRIAFSERYESIDKVTDFLQSNLVFLSPDKKSLNFADLLSEIDLCCKVYSDDPEPFRNPVELGEVEFRISIEKIYLELQNFLKEESI